MLIIFFNIQQGKAAPNLAKRYEINAKRIGVNPQSEEGLAASREFIRIDSTYYVGWMFEGLYLSERAADYSGYKHSIAPLQKALDLIEKDYAKELKVKTSNFDSYFAVQQYQADYSNIAYALFTAFQNSESNEESFQLLKRVQKWDMQREWQLNTYTMLFWITHRNRFYTHKKYSFLKNDVDQNEKLANSYLDSALLRLDRMKPYNQGVFPEFYTEYDHLTIYHYKCIFYAYNFKIDSAQYYFSLMEGTSMFPYNNYANFLSVIGNFKESEANYEIASKIDNGDKRLQEWAYFGSILDIYKGNPSLGVQKMKDMIMANGSTPGFGWYNIALARACSYEGNLAESEKYSTKAANFKELHIGTTLGQPQYEFAINLVNLLNTTKSINAVKFEDKNWWWHPKSLLKILNRKIMEKGQQYLITNQFASNPERDNVIYKLFSTENIVSWDETWLLIKDFSTRFFHKKFETELQSDKREKIYKYYNLFLAKLEIKQGKYKTAKSRLEKVLKFTEDIDIPYEKLFLARCYEALAICADELDEKEYYQFYQSQMYRYFPQLMPYTEFKPQMQLNINGSNKALEKKLKKFNIDWVNANHYAPKTSIIFTTENNKTIILYSVRDYQGNVTIPDTKIVVEDEQEAVNSLAYGLFGINALDS
ncbi:MAG TPA: hypothetical protein PKX92_11465 [Edaphocola sp.]|nr:hypothetical protein [Edaphocola sp.]